MSGQIVSYRDGGTKDPKAGLSRRDRDVWHHETREVMAIAQAMCRLFTFHQLVTCSMKGATTTTGSPRPSLPAAERNAIIDVIAKTFDKPLVDVEEKMRGCLRHLRLMHK
ncbi:hypothetical protein DPMN_135554 [Dreissena polymorpha]|uniref:BEN domain-containing protein n=2 Tax=Dreissena polymorpha TaxID=45954 RepID=A0A9D4FXZ1_DREPO|nr:hypothetical protein DPMN_135554 [Dreissena polymorpha]